MNLSESCDLNDGGGKGERKGETTIFKGGSTPIIISSGGEGGGEPTGFQMRREGFFGLLLRIRKKGEES